MLPAEYGAFATAVAASTPRGIAIVEDAINTAINEIEDELGNVDPRHFENKAFIPAHAFGAADRSSQLAVHHARAHAVITDTLVGVKDELTRFQEACRAARAVFETTEEGVASEMRIRLAVVQALQRGATGRGDTAYNEAVYANADVRATDEEPQA